MSRIIFRLIAFFAFGFLAGVILASSLHAQGEGTSVTFKDQYNVTYTCQVTLRYDFPNNKLYVDWAHSVNNGYTASASTYNMAMAANNTGQANYGQNNYIPKQTSQFKSGTKEYSLSGTQYVRFGTSYGGNWYGEYRDAIVTNCQPQTVLVTPATGGTIYAGQGKQWQLEGREPGGGLYKGEIVTGGGALSVNGSTGVALFTPASPGPYGVRFWIDSVVPDWCKSEDVVVGGNVVTTNFDVTIPLDNRKSIVATTFYIFQDGNLITTRTVAAGERALFTMAVPTGSDVYVKLARDYTDGAIFTVNPEGTIDHTTIGIYTPHAQGDTPPPNPPDAKTPAGYTPPDNPPPKSNDDPTPAPPPSPNKPPGQVWSNSDASTGESLKNDVFAEGTGKVVGAVDAVRAALESEHAKNDLTREEAGTVKGVLPSDPGGAVDAGINNAQQSADGAASDLEASSAVEGIRSFASAANVPSGISGGGTSVTATASGPITQSVVGGSSFDLSPTASGGAQSLLGIDFSWFLTWVKHFIAATAVLWFLKEVVDAVRGACYALANSPQHLLGGSTEIVKSVAVFGNQFGAIPAAVMWGVVVIAVTAAIIAAPTLIAVGVYLAANVGGIISDASSAASALSVAAGSGAAGVFSKVFALVNAVCPVGLLIVIALNRVILSITVFVQFVAFHVTVKLIGFL